MVPMRVAQTAEMSPASALKRVARSQSLSSK